jgi:hypothetical protein
MLAHAATRRATFDRDGRERPSSDDPALCAVADGRARSLADMTNSGAAATKTTTLRLALLGGFARQGRWQMRRHTVTISAVGGVDLDLTEATLPSEDATVIKVSLVGGAKLRVPTGLNVVVEGFHLIGRRRNDTGPIVPGAPTVRLFAYGIFGGVLVERAG